MAVLAYRTAIERFYAAAIKLSCQGCIADNVRAKHLCRKSCNYYMAKESFVILFLINLLFIASSKLTFSHKCTVFSLLNLTCRADVESNPGPTYSIEKIIFVSSHKGDPRFRHKTSLYAFCWSQVRKAYQ